MQSRLNDPYHHVELRTRALSRLTGSGSRDDSRVSLSTAIGVLYQLASSPHTASDALALLHELQVHQVELDLQNEELQLVRADMEATLRRQVQLYDYSPAGSCTIDRSTAISEINLTGARLLNVERATLLGRRLADFLPPAGRQALDAALARVADSGARTTCTLPLPASGEPVALDTVVAPDPSGSGFLLALLDLGAAR
jgi:PAS domain-containing protein